MAASLLTNRRRKTRGGSLDVGGTQTTSVENTNEPVGRAPTIPDLRIHEEPSLQNVSAPTRTHTIEYNLPPTTETAQPRNVAFDENAGSQPLHPAKSEGKGDDGSGENAEGQGNVVVNMQARFTAAKSSRVWDTYVRKAEEEDKDLVEDWDRVIDVTLVFAALFSAISTGFVLESSKGLQPDQAKATVLAVQSLTSAIQAGANGSTVPSTESYEDSFKPTVLTIWVNCLWFLSLGLSISVSLFAMLAKRWCYVFRSKRTGTSHERAMKRQKSWDAIEKWRVELVIEQLPTLMHIALMLFFFGLIVYLAEIHQTTMIVTTALAGFTIAVYIALTALPLWYKNCPMVTPFTRILLATRLYLFEGSTFIATRAWLYFGSTSISSMSRNLRGLLSNWRQHLKAMASIPAQALRSIKSHSVTFWKQLVRFATVSVPVTRKEKSSTESDWVLYGCPDPSVGKTIQPPQPDENNRHAFNALLWILNTSTDRETVKEVLDFILNFPHVILDSSVGSDQLYTLASTAVEHLNRLEHDPAEWRHTSHIDSLCAMLIYLTTRPWLHESTDTGSKRFELLPRDRQFGYIDMSPEEVEKQVGTFREKTLKQSESVARLEHLAGRIVLGCTPESGLKICAALGRTLLNGEASLNARHLDVEFYPTLWWIFLNTVLDCTGGCWPCSHYEDQLQDVTQVLSDSTLTLGHFRNMRKRQESSLWLTVVGITGMLYAFVDYPDHEDGPAKDGNNEYFGTLIGFLRSTLRVQVSHDTDPFLGDLPVYNGTEVRLYQFDSLEYAIAALSSALGSPLYTDCLFSGELHLLLHELKDLRDLKRLLRPNKNHNVDYNGALKTYKSKTQAEQAPGLFLTAGILSITPLKLGLEIECAHLLANFLPDIVFGCNVSAGSSRASPKVGLKQLLPTFFKRRSNHVTCVTFTMRRYEGARIWKIENHGSVLRAVLPGDANFSRENRLK